MNRKPSRLAACLIMTAAACMASSAASLRAQEKEIAGVLLARPRAELRPEAYGTGSLTMVQIPAVQCTPVAGTTFASEANGYFYATGGPGAFDCPINLPAGSKPAKLDVVAYDAADGGSVDAIFANCPSVDVSALCNGVASVSSSGTAAAPFTGYLSLDLTPYGIVVDKAANLYFVRVLMATGSTARFREVDLYYRLQVSTALPGTQTFGDVPPTHPYYKAIEALSASAITGGCGSGNFCPGGNVTRGELAAFLARALGLHFPN